jgi:adenylylsulfate kinase
MLWTSMAWVTWFTGLPGCGKTTIAKLVKAYLLEKGVDVKILQLDEIRKVITPQPKYTDEERDIVYASLAYMAKLLAEARHNVIVDATANRRRYRDLARKLVPAFAEVYIRADIDTCMVREAQRKAEFAPRDIYERAVREKAPVPGINVDYEEPLAPEIVVDSARTSPDQSARFVAERIEKIFGDRR